MIGSIEDDFEKVVVLAEWVNVRWSHSSSNTPSSSNPLVILRKAADGDSFRCVEYSIVMAGASQAIGMPARVVGLKTRHAATARLAAGHVVTEVWLSDHNKWIVVDPQLGYTFRLKGIPLNAVELGQALFDSPRSVEVLSGDGPVTGFQKIRYLLFVGPYLFHFDSPYDQRVFLDEQDRIKGGVMLVPVGAPPLTVFQRQYSLAFDDFTSSADAFYATPSIAP